MNDPVVQLKNDHREAETLLKELAASKPGARRRTTVTKLERALLLHMQIEEQLVYPLIAKEVGGQEAHAAEVEHGLAREGLAKMVELTDEAGFGAAVAMVTAGIKHHVKEEEQELFPGLKRKLDRQTLGELGDAVASAKSSKGRR